MVKNTKKPKEFYNFGLSKKRFIIFIANMSKMANYFFENYKKIRMTGVCVSDSFLLYAQAALFFRVQQKNLNRPYTLV